MDQLRDIVGLGFLHAIALMVFHGMDTQFKFVGYHFTAESFLAKFDNLQLPEREVRPVLI
jgi:hypothetical protein